MLALTSPIEVPIRCPTRLALMSWDGTGSLAGSRGETVRRLPQP